MSDNQSESNKKYGLNILSSIGKRVSKVLLITFISGIGLCISENSYLRKECDLNKQPIACFAAPITLNLGLSLITSVITIIVAELALRDEVLQQIQDIWNSRQATRYIKGFYPKESDYKNLIAKNISESQYNHKIKFLCFLGELSFLKDDNNTMRTLNEKLRSGCHLQILILHPESSVLSHMEKSGLGCSKGDISVGNTLKKVGEAFQGRNALMKGSIEVRLKKDLFSPIGYYSSSNMNLVWMCFSNPTKGNGSQSPGFEILDVELSKEAKLHFENLWDKSKGESNLLLKINSHDYHNEIDKKFN